MTNDKLQMTNKIQNPNFKFIIFIIITLFAFSPALASSTTDISVVALGARSVAMGRAGVAVLEGSNNIFVNPAVISTTKSWDLTSMSTQLLGIVDYNFLSGNLKTKKGTVGLSYVGAASPAGYYTTDEDSLSSALPINYSSSVMALSYGIKLSDLMPTSGNTGNLSAGANLKYYQQGFSGSSLSSSNASGVGVDLGLLLEAKKNLSIGLDLQNIIAGDISWDTGTGDSLLKIAKFGAAGKVLNNKVLVAADVDYYLAEARPLTFHAGAEWQPANLFVLRAGIDQSATSSSSVATNLCAGVGINLRGFQLDLAYRQDSTLTDNSNFYLSLSYAPYLPQLANTNVDEEPEIVVGGKEQSTVTSPQAIQASGIQESILGYYK